MVSFCFSCSSVRVVVAVTSDPASEPMSSGSGPGVSVYAGRATMVSHLFLLCCVSLTFSLACSSDKVSSASSSGSIPAIRLLYLADWDLVALDSAMVDVA